MKKTLTIDLWNTLIYDHPDVDAARRDLRLSKIGKILERSAGFDFQRHWPRMRAAYEASWEFLEKTWHTGREVVPAEQLKIYLNLLYERNRPEQLPEAELLNAYLEPILKHLPLPMPGSREVLTSLKQKGWKLGLISNTGRTSGIYLRRVLQKHGVFELFDTCSFSDEFGRRKPDSVLFEKTLEALGAQPENSFHLGDNWEADVAGAQKAGLTPLWFVQNGAGAPDPAVTKVHDWLELESLLRN